MTGQSEDVLVGRGPGVTLSMGAGTSLRIAGWTEEEEGCGAGPRPPSAPSEREAVEVRLPETGGAR